MRLNYFMHNNPALFLKSKKNTELFFSKLFAIDYAVSQISLLFENNKVTFSLFAKNEQIRKALVSEYNTIGEAILTLANNKECNSVLNNFADASVWAEIKIVRGAFTHDYSPNLDRTLAIWQEIDLARQLFVEFKKYLIANYSNIEEKLAEYKLNREQILKNLSEITDKRSKAIEEETFQRTNSIISNLKNK